MSWRDDLNYGLAAFGIQIPERFSLDEKLSGLTEKPATSVAQIVAASAVVFYMAERGHNPKVKSLWDAMIFTSTCLSVGYSDILARTPVGKMVGTALMTYGPALATKSLDGKAKAPDTTQEDILKTLRAILQKLESSDSSPAVT